MLCILLIILIYFIIGVFFNGIVHHIYPDDILDYVVEFGIILVWPIMFFILLFMEFGKILVHLSKFVTGFLDNINR